jgi:hypothetical protein
MPTRPTLITLLSLAAFAMKGDERRVPAVIVELALTKFLREDE